MAQGYDGDIKLSVSLSTDDVKSSAQSLSNDIKAIFNKSAGKELDSKFQRLQSAMSKSVTKAQELQSAMERLEKTEVPTDEYKEIQTQIEKSTIALNRLQERMEKFTETGGKTSSTAFKKMQYDAAQLENTIEYAKGELQDLVDTGKAFKLGSDTVAYENLKNQLGESNNQMRTLITSAEQYSQTADKAVTKTNRFSGILRGVRGILGRVGNGLKSLAQRFLHVGSSAQSLGNKLGMSFKNILTYAIGIRSLFSLFSKLRSAISSGISDMAKLNGGMNQTNAAMSQLQASLNLLRGSLAAAFTPILTVVAPILSNFIDQIASVITAIGMMIAKLTGAKSYFRATKTSANYAGGGGGSSGKSAEEKYQEAVEKAQKKYDEQVAKTQEKNAKAAAKAEEQQAKAAEKLAKAQEKANRKLADFDDLNVLNIEDMEELEEIEAEVYDMPELELPDREDFQDALSGGGGAGDPFGLEEVPLDDFEWNWDAIKAKAEELGRGIADKLNDFFKNEAWAAELGKNIAEALNTALHFAYGFIDQFNWRQFGHWLGVLVREGIETFEWDLLGKTIGKFLNGIADTIIGFFETYPVGLLGSKIALMLNNAIDEIDPQKIGQAVLDVLQAPLIELTELLTQANWELAGSKIAEFFDRVFNSEGLRGRTLGQTVADFCNAIADTIIRFFTGYPPGTLGASISKFLNDAIGTIHKDEIGQALLAILQEPFLELKEILTETNWRNLGTLVGNWFRNVFSEEGLKGKSLGTVIGETLAAAINAGVDFLLGMPVNTIVQSLVTFFEDIIISALSSLDWWDIFNAMLGRGGLLDALISLHTRISTFIDSALLAIKSMILNAIADIVEQLPGPVREALNLIMGDYREKANEARELSEQQFQRWNEFKDGTITAYDEMSGRAKDYHYMLGLIADGVTFNKDRLSDFIETGRFTEDQVDNLIKAMQEYATESGKSLDLASLGLEDYEGKWNLFVARQELRNDTLLKGHAAEKESIEGVATATDLATTSIKNEMLELKNQTDTYSSDTNVKLDTMQDNASITVTSFEDMANQLNTSLEGLQTYIQEWYNSMVENYFNYDVWMTLFNEGPILALTDFITLFIETWNIQMQLWWDEGVLPWFSSEKWDGELLTPLLDLIKQKWEQFNAWWNTTTATWFTNLKTKWNTLKTWMDTTWNTYTNNWFEALKKKWAKLEEWWNKTWNEFTQKWFDELKLKWQTLDEWWNTTWNTAINTWFKETQEHWNNLLKWWDKSINIWWTEHVEPWFKQDKWEEQFNHIKEAAHIVFEGVRDEITDRINEAADAVSEACEGMKSAIAEVIAMLNEAIALAAQLASIGGGGGGSSSSSSGSGGGGGGGNSSGGGYSFMPRLEVMHFEDNLGMSAFKFPELAKGAVIPPNEEFLAVLGDQKSGYNIETPLNTMLEAFRTVMDEYNRPVQQSATMEVDGETFARLMLPYVIDEMHRQGYNTDIIVDGV